ncbi:MAG: ROK family protein [Elusimicrobiales bacterium]|nr:ROK family protein [Elusimicrobiales bacterium]
MRGIGVDVGGTEIKIAVVNKNLEVLCSDKFPTPLSNGYNYFVKKTAKIIKNFISKYKANKICFAIAGDVDSEKGILRFAPNLCNWENKNIKKDFEKECNVEVIVENDANMAIWGGYVFELKKKYKNVVGFTLGTGVGGGVIIDGNLIKGSTTTAGELGHMVIKVGGDLCACGNRGCLEAYCSTKKICYEAKKRIKNVSKDITPKYIFDIAVSGNKIAREIWYEYGEYLGFGIGNIVMSLNPDVILLTGGLSGAYMFFMDGVENTLRKYGIRKPIDYIKIHITSTKNLGVLGCAEFVMEKR